MIRFDTDYMAGAHPEVMRRLLETNLENTTGYGTDSYCRRARELVRELCGDFSLDVEFLMGGTQTNSVIIDALLKRPQGVLCTDCGHINVHEAGAVEASGHKVLTLPSEDGKTSAAAIREYIDGFYSDDSFRHMVSPGMVYLTFPTEYGTLYTRKELSDIHDVCLKAGIPLYIDGARLGYALASPACDIALKDLPELCEAFYIGGTKCGALFGECIVAKKGLLGDFFPLVKSHGALLAKGRLLGLQFLTLLQDNLYIDSCAYANSLALKIREAFTSKGYAPVVDSRTNQQFFCLPNALVDSLRKDFSFENWGPRGARCTRIRIVTSWATREEDVEALIASL